MARSANSILISVIIFIKLLQNNIDLIDQDRFNTIIIFKIIIIANNIRIGLRLFCKQKNNLFDIILINNEKYYFAAQVFFYYLK